MRKHGIGCLSAKCFETLKGKKKTGKQILVIYGVHVTLKA